VELVETGYETDPCHDVLMSSKNNRSNNMEKYNNNNNNNNTGNINYNHNVHNKTTAINTIAPPIIIQ